MYEIKIYKSRWKAVKLILLSLPFVVVSLYDILTHSINMSPSLSWFALCFFGLGIPIGLFNLFDMRPEMVLNENGIFDRMSYGVFVKNPNKGFVTWNSIEDAWIKSYQGESPQGTPTSKQDFICIKLNKEAASKIKKSKLSDTLGFGDYNIPLMNLKKFDQHRFFH
ncbi:MAG: STM3941 family protein [Mucilaginibacter sp.]